MRFTEVARAFLEDVVGALPYPGEVADLADLLTWARDDALDEAARVADSCVRDECSPGFIARRIRALRTSSVSDNQGKTET